MRPARSRLSWCTALAIAAAGCAGPTIVASPQSAAEPPADSPSAPIVCDDALGPEDPLRPMRAMVEAVSDSGEVCVISIGLPHKVIPGLRYIVSRRGEDIAALTIDWIFKDHSAARITNASEPVRVGDRVRGPSVHGGASNIPGLSSFETSDGSGLAPTPAPRRVKGLVLAADESACVLSVGSADTVFVGEEFTISRGSHFVAVITVERVWRDQCVGVVQPRMALRNAQSGDLAWSEWRETRHDEPIGIAK